MPVADLSYITQSLSLTPNLLRAVVDGRPEEWLDRRHAEDVVSPREAVAHLVLCEGYWSWVDRTKAILDPSHKPGSEEEMSEAKILAAFTFNGMLDEFERLRFEAIRKLQELELTEEDLGKLNPKGTCSVRQLLATWVSHDLYHIGQIFKSYSAPFADQIGPYQNYLNLPHFN